MSTKQFWYKNQTYMKPNILTLMIAIFLLCGRMDAQDVPKQWTLEECIRYAIANNVKLKQQEQEKEARTIELDASKSSWAPNLNAYVGQNVDFGRTLAEYTYVNKSSANSSLQVQMSMPVFNGFKIPNNIAMRKLNLKAATESLN
jgi:outer membrane protein